MRIVRTLLVSSLAALSIGVAAPSASACWSVQCITTCVGSVVDGDLKIYCPL